MGSTYAEYKLLLLILENHLYSITVITYVREVVKVPLNKILILYSHTYIAILIQTAYPFSYRKVVNVIYNEFRLLPKIKNIAQFLCHNTVVRRHHKVCNWRDFYIAKIGLIVELSTSQCTAWPVVHIKPATWKPAKPLPHTWICHLMLKVLYKDAVTSIHQTSSSQLASPSLCTIVVVYCLLC